MTVKSNYHGLSAHTRAAAALDNRRLERPVDNIVNNMFNDASSGHLYAHPSGHAGIDFLSGQGTDVKAMYGGVVVKVVNTWTVSNNPGLGRLVTIRSCTDPATGAGFEHIYAHLQTASVTEGDSVAKGHMIGTTGASGTYYKTPSETDPNKTSRPQYHLHVQL